MTPLLTRSGARANDARVIEAGVPGLILMENAGRGAADVIVDRFAGQLGRVVVVGGTGQNGGDAWVIARRLATLGHRPEVFVAGDRARVGGDAKVNLAALEAVGISVRETRGGEGDGLPEAIASATLLIEGLFGTGLDRAIEGWRAGLVAALDAAPAPLVALDLPSGIDADTGAILGVAPRATLTVTFAGHKRGLWQAPGRHHAGEVAVVDIGVPPPKSADQLLALWDVHGILPPRANDAHKGTAGHVLVVAGAAGKTGAAILTGMGAMRGGAGLVTLAAGPVARAALDQKVIEIMTADLSLGLALAEGKAALIVGPGMGLDDSAQALALAFAQDAVCPAVLDADALTALASAGIETLRVAAGPRVLTPHPKEAARLLGSSTAEIQADRYGAAQRLADEAGQVIVLKGAGTVVAEPGGRLAVCPLGTPALGVAGTGDVLAGVIGAALSAAGPFQAACAAVLLHARAGELAAHADRGLFAREVADQVPVALAESRGHRTA